MKRQFAPLVGLALSVLVSACGAVGAPETPRQALASAAQKTTQLKSVKYDFTGSISMKLPPIGQSLGAAGKLAIDFTGRGEAVFPDRSHTTVSTRMGSISIDSETVVIGMTVYVKNPMTGRWISAAGTGSPNASSLTLADPLSSAQLLDSAESITDLGDSTLDGATVHHYRVVLDKAKLMQRVQSLPAYRSPQAQQLFRQIIAQGTLVLEVWFGKDDHLVRRISADASITLDVSQLTAIVGGAAMSPGATAQMTQHSVINYHDFNAPVTVTAPPLS